MARLPGGAFRGLPREVGGLTAVAFTVALGYGIAAPAIPAADALGRRPVIMAGAIAGAGGMLMLALPAARAVRP